MNSKHRQTIFKSIQPKKRKLELRNDSDDDDDGIDYDYADDHDNDNDNDNDDRALLPTKRANLSSSKSEILKLPGASVGTINSYTTKCVGSGIGEAPREVVQQIRSYMDILLNSAILEACYITSTEMNQVNSLLAIPGIVSAILEYNNITFKTIRYCVTRAELFEPVWYTYNITKNELILYINEAMYEEFCSKSSKDAVIFTSGIIPIEIFNPYESNPTLDTTIQASIIHCAIASDHVAQHIISDLYCPNKIACADIHENFNEVGTTLHSMFHLERSCTRMPKREFTNFLTLGGGGGNSTMPLMRSTQKLIDSIIPPHGTNGHRTSDNFAYAI